MFVTQHTFTKKCTLQIRLVLMRFLVCLPDGSSYAAFKQFVCRTAPVQTEPIEDEMWVGWGKSECSTPAHTTTHALGGGGGGVCGAVTNHKH